ncbi:hypothetical protein [Streptomyces sp. NPDC058755]|uniref:hypothetical protein n=1 Tax=Streptomyces sp. NPDC058755 TaxID=3346624 RepID=UPI0036B0ADD1
MTEGRQPVIAEVTHEALARCQAIGGGAVEAVEALRAELEKTPTLGRRAGRAVGEMTIYTTRLEPTDTSTTPRHPSPA